MSDRKQHRDHEGLYHWPDFIRKAPATPRERQWLAEHAPQNRIAIAATAKGRAEFCDALQTIADYPLFTSTFERDGKVEEYVAVDVALYLRALARKALGRPEE